VIDATDDRRLRDRHPYNVVRVELTTASVAGGSDDRYDEAARTLRTWREQGALVEDTAPAFYLHEATFAGPHGPATRRELIAAVRLEPWDKQVVLPHERTFPRAKADRLRLLEATQINISPILVFFRRDGQTGTDTVDEAWAWTDGREPDATGIDSEGVAHRLWVLTDPALVGGIQAYFSARPLFIADGHHRYETAVAYAERHPDAGDKLMAFFALEAPGLTILPNHRLVHGIRAFDFEDFVQMSARWFEVSPLHDPLTVELENRTIAVVSGPDAAVLRLKPGASDHIAWPEGRSAAWRGLAVSILHEGLLRPLLGITDAKLDAKTHVEYTADRAEAIALAREGKYQAAFLIAPTTVDELEAVVSGGELLPQKSTHFYPKLLDGLVFHRLGE
jgi:uncharacterized protein (DUF1015 family)